MSDETFSIIAGLSIIASVAAIWNRILYRRALRRLMDSLTPEQIEAIKRAAAQSDPPKS